jgi:hypothetical protein
MEQEWRDMNVVLPVSSPTEDEYSALYSLYSEYITPQNIPQFILDYFDEQIERFI